MLFLKNRATQLKELMDDPDCDKLLLFNTYKQFILINIVFSRWKKIYRQYLLPYFKANNGQGSLLDVGCGGGDVLLFIDKLAKKDGISLELHGIDPEASAIEFIKTKQVPSNIHFQQCWLKDLVPNNKKYDFVITNNILHHLTDQQFLEIRQDSEKLATKMVIFNDLHRSAVAWLFFRLFAPLFFHNSYSAHDGCISIKRSYTKNELVQILPKNWEVRQLFPYRNLVIKNIT